MRFPDTKEMLLSGYFSVSETAYECGFSETRYFNAVLRFFKIAINPRFDDIEKQVEQEVQLVSRLVEMRDL